MFSTTCENEAANRGTVSEFITERQYLKNVTPKTLTWYGDAFKAFQGALDSEVAIKNRIVKVRNQGNFRNLRQFLAPVHQGLLEMSGAGFKLPKLKEECSATIKSPG